MGKEELDIVQAIFNSPVIQLVVVSLPLYMVWQMLKVIRVKDITPSLTSLVKDLIEERQNRDEEHKHRDEERKQELEYKQGLNEALGAIIQTITDHEKAAVQSRAIIQRQEQTIIDGIKTITDHTTIVKNTAESVDTMNERFDRFQEQLAKVELLLAGGLPMAENDRLMLESKFDLLSKTMQEVLTQINNLQKFETEAPTQKIESVIKEDIADVSSKNNNS